MVGPTWPKVQTSCALSDTAPPAPAIIAPPLRAEDLFSLQTRRSAACWVGWLGQSIIDGPKGTISSGLIALARLFRLICRGSGLDPVAAFIQINQAEEEGRLGLKDDPARGEFIHPAPALLQ